MARRLPRSMRAIGATLVASVAVACAAVDPAVHPADAAARVDAEARASPSSTSRGIDPRGWADAQRSFADQVVRIGHAGPLSGRARTIGRDAERGALLAIETLNARAMVVAGRRLRFELVPVDDGADPERAIAAARALLSAGVVGVVGHPSPEAAQRAAAVYERAAVPLVTPAPIHAGGALAASRSSFRIAAPEDRSVRDLGAWLARERGVRTAFVVYDGTEPGRSAAAALRGGFEAAGVNVVASAWGSGRPAADRVLSELLLASGAQVVAFGGSDEAAASLIAGLRAGGFDGPVIGGEEVCTDTLAARLAAARAEGGVYCGSAMSSSERTRADDWHRRFERRFGRRPDAAAQLAFDATMTIAQAMRAADSTEPAAYLPRLRTVEHRGVTGTIAFDARGAARPRRTIVREHDATGWRTRAIGTS